MKLKDRIALVTGGGSGLGRAIALLFAEEGAHVIVNELRLEAAEQTVASMKGPAGGRAIQADVADSAQVKAMFATIEREVGGLDILVNNAGIAFGPGDDRAEVNRKSEAMIMELLSGQGGQTHFDVTQNLSDESWRRMLAVHVDGTFYCTREALKLMSRKNRGAIVNLSSVAALTGLEVVPHYSAAKGAILSFTRAVAKDVASRGIRVNAICPGTARTPMIASAVDAFPDLRDDLVSRLPIGRLATPEEIAEATLWLCSDASSFVLGAAIAVDGGYTAV